MLWRVKLFDPRALLVALLVVNVLLTTSMTLWLLLIITACLGVAMSLVAPKKLVLGWFGFVLFWLLGHFAPLAWPSSGTVLLGFVSVWIIRFSAIFASYVAFGYLLDLHRLGAVLQQMRLPRAIYVPLMTILRFFPIAVGELKAIVEAMTLRGLRPGPRGFLRHPLRTGEYVVIPFLAAAARTADELSAAAILKGLGAQRNRSCVISSHFGRSDYLLLSAILLLFVLYIWAVWL